MIPTYEQLAELTQLAVLACVIGTVGAGVSSIIWALVDRRKKKLSISTNRKEEDKKC